MRRKPARGMPKNGARRFGGGSSATGRRQQHVGRNRHAVQGRFQDDNDDVFEGGYGAEELDYEKLISELEGDLQVVRAVPRAQVRPVVVR